MEKRIQTTKSLLSIFISHLIILISIIIAMNTGCAVNKHGSTETIIQACTVSDSMIHPNGAPGVQFVNKCKDCIAVAFEYRNYEKSSIWTACYVPSHSRVVFREAKEYWLVAQKTCTEAKKHGLGGVATAEMENNVQTSRCDTVSVVND